MENIFFIIGVQRCGTTYLYKILDEHPEISMARPLRPEPKFFLNDIEFSKGLKYYESKYFNYNNGEKVCGEKTAGYCESEKVAKRIRLSYPNSKIIMILRNPIYRALSNYFFSLKNGLETRSIEEVFLDNIPVSEYDPKIILSPFDYLERGKYIEYIQNYMKYFDKTKSKIIIMEYFVGNEEKISELYGFLGVSNQFIPNSINKKINSNGIDYSKINRDVIGKLAEHFIEYNISLKNHFNFNLEVWNA